MTTYALLKSDARTWLTRSDLTDGIMNSAMRMAEADVGIRLRVRAQETVASLVFTSDAAALPADFLEAISITSSDLNSPALRLVTAQALRRLSLGAQSGQPVKYAIEGLNVRIAPVATVTDPITLTLTYFARLPTMTLDTDSNWFSLNAYTVMLYALLRALCELLQETEAEQRYDAKLERAIERLRIADNQSRLGGGPLQSRFYAAE